METINNIEIVATLVLTIWSITLGWASWQVHIMTREVERERLALRRWVRLKGLREGQERGRWQ
jgi:hypothetical protein